MHLCLSQGEDIEFFFQPLQFGVACRAGAEKIVHSLRNCIKEYWMQEDDFVVFKVDMHSTLFLGRRFLINAQLFPPKSCPGCLGVMALTQNCGIL